MQTQPKSKPGILGIMLLRLLIQRLLVPTLVLILLPLALASFMWDRSLAAQQMQLARVLANTVETFLHNAENMLRSAAKVADGSTNAQLSFYLMASREGFAYFDTIYRLDSKGIIVKLEPYEPRYLGLDQSRQPYFIQAKAQPGLCISRPFNSMRTGKPTVSMSWPLADGGMMVAELNLGTFQDAVTAARQEEGKSAIIIADQAGTLLAHPRPELIAQQARIGDLPLLQRAGSGETTLHYRAGDQWMLGSCTRVKSTGWVVLVQAPLAAVYGALAKAAVPIILLCLGVWVIVVLTFQKSFQRHVVTPLAELSQTAIAISSGDLQRSAAVETEDEIGIVAKAFNSMTAQLREVIGRLEERVDQLTRTREELKTHRQQLEKLVEARTAALAERTQQLEAQAVELSAAKKQAEAASAAKSDFLARMSHEIRTPLSAVTGLTHLVLKSELTAEQRDYLNKVQIASNNLLSVINDILDFSKVEAGRLELSVAPFDLDQVLEELADLFSDRTAQKDLEMIFSVAPQVPRQLAGDAGRLTQVLTNLIENAVKFTDQGEIVVGVEAEDPGDQPSGPRALKFRVSDTGAGIAADMLPSLFEPFTQVDSYLTRKHEGTGLGLAICRRLAELMGGRIWAESTPGRGSTFSFTAMMEVRRQQKPHLSLPPDLRGLKTLVVDDSAAARQMLCDLLESFHFKVTAADTGEKALEELGRAATGESYHLVLLDWKMPGMDGIETARRIRQWASQVQDQSWDASHPSLAQERKPPIIILVTAYGHELMQARMDRAAVDTLLLKPVKPTRLFNVIMTLFGRQEAVVASMEKKRAKGHGLLAGRRVLLVEDSELNRDVAVALLAERGLVVEIAENGKVAVEKVTESPQGFYDAVLMDIQMPVMDGYQATRHIRQWESGVQGATSPADASRVPIIALTAHALRGEKEKCLAAGMDDYLAKPLDEKELDQMLLTRVRSPRQDGQPPNRPQPQEPSCQSAVLDVQGALRRLGGRRQLYIKALKEFAPDCGPAHEIIARHLAAGDREAASRVAHTIKGTAATIGAVILTETAAKLEKAISFDGTEIGELSKELQDRLNLTLEAVAGFLAAEAES